VDFPGYLHRELCHFSGFRVVSFFCRESGGLNSESRAFQEQAGRYREPETVVRIKTGTLEIMKA
jgi:hypothetical protein